VDGSFVDRPPDGKVPEIGTSWDAYLYEYAVWSPNTAILCGYQTFLKINYEVQSPFEIRLGFSLHSCQGGLLLAAVMPDGIDVDSGYEYLQGEQLSSTTGPGYRFNIKVLKNLRYTDLLTRRTPQGPSGSGQFSNLLAAASVGLWMTVLVYQLLYGPQPPPAAS